MTNKKAKHVEVIAAYTLPIVWKAVKQKHIATQANSAADADYIAFIRIGLRNKKGKRLPGGVLAHIAKVKEIRYEKPLAEYGKGIPELAELCKEKGWKGTHKEYYLEKIEELPRPIPHKRGDFGRSQVKFYTTLEELRNAKVLSDIKTISQLKKEMKSL